MFLSPTSHSVRLSTDSSYLLRSGIHVGRVVARGWCSVGRHVGAVIAVSTKIAESGRRCAIERSSVRMQVDRVVRTSKEGRSCGVVPILLCRRRRWACIADQSSKS